MEKFYMVYAEEYIGPVYISSTLEGAEDHFKKKNYHNIDGEEGCATIRVVNNEMNLLESRYYEHFNLVNVKH